METEEWTEQTSAEAAQWESICYAKELNLFVAVAATGTSRVQTSPDGITWTSRTAAESKMWTGIAWSPSLSLFAAVSRDATSAVMTSPDGITWTSRTPASTSIQWQDICWSSSLGLFVAVGSYTSGNRIMTSSDGINWTGQTEANNFNSVIWANSLGLLIAVGFNATTSPDGITWTHRTATNSLNAVTWSESLGILVAVGPNICYTSPDGINWTSRTIDACAWQAVTWAEEAGIFIAVANNNSNRIAIFHDGIIWTSDIDYTTISANAITYANELNLAVIMCAASPYILTNPYPFASNIKSISSNGSTLAAAGISIAYTSSNGTAWLKHTIPTGTYNDLTYGNSLYVAVGTDVCATSPDGTTWTSRTIPAGTWNKVTYSSELDLFVAVGDGVIATSPDGITWTSRTVPAANNWTGVAWDGTRFTIVSSDGDNRTATSTDGITWTLQTASADFSLAYTDGITHSIERGLKEVHFLWRDEAAATHTEGDTDKPQWNLGYLESTDSPPSTRVDPFYKFRLACVPVRLDITDGDRVHFDPFWTLDPAYPTDAQVLVSEKFNTSKTPAWYQDIESLSLFNSVEGGSLPSTIERVAAYTPLVTTGFDGNLDSTVNNLQALADRVDDLNLGSAPTTTAANDFQVGNGAGAWIKKTLAETITILRTSLDLIFAPIAKGVTNLHSVTQGNRIFGIDGVCLPNLLQYLSCFRVSE